jgi:hypothetical protein
MVQNWRDLVKLTTLLVLGLAAGIGFGLFLGWVAWPAEFTEADPTVLEDSYQRDYALMIAAAYSLDEDLDDARRRIRSLGLEDSDAWLMAMTVDHILIGGNDLEIRQLVRLSTDLGLYSPAMDPFLEDDTGDEEA